MKKTLLFFVAILIIQSSAFAQFTNLWQKKADGTDYTWFSSSANANNVASLAYNPATDKLLVSNRNTNVYILNAATGAQEGTLSNTGLGSESFKFNKIRVDNDGVIYGISLATGAGSCKIYRWASQSDNPVLCATFTVTERCGDSFGLSGTGINTVLYASGSGTTSNAFNIYILNTTDGINFTTESKVTMTSSPTTNQQWSNRVVEPVGTGVNSDIWINGGGFTAKRISISAPTSGVRSGTVVTEIADGTGAGQASIGYGGMRYVTGTAKKILAFAGGNNTEAGTVMRALDVTNESSITTYGTETLPTTYTTNGNATGDVSFKVNNDGSFVTYYLSTNNGIGATTTGPNVLPVSLTSFNATLKNDINTLTWVTTSESNNSGFDVESSVNGKDFKKIGFVASKGINNNSTQTLNYSFTDYQAQTGVTYYRLKQLDLDGKFTYSDIKAINNSLSNSLSFSIFPNPASDYIDIDTKLDDMKAYEYALYNTEGKKIISQKISLNSRLNISSLTPNIYILNIMKDNRIVQSMQIVKK